jgi:hypothetical protein
MHATSQAEVIVIMGPGLIRRIVRRAVAFFTALGT